MYKLPFLLLLSLLLTRTWTISLYHMYKIQNQNVQHNRKRGKGQIPVCIKGVRESTPGIPPPTPCLAMSSRILRCLIASSSGSSCQGNSKLFLNLSKSPHKIFQDTIFNNEKSISTEHRKDKNI